MADLFARLGSADRGQGRILRAVEDAMQAAGVDTSQAGPYFLAFCDLASAQAPSIGTGESFGQMLATLRLLGASMER